MKKTKKILYVIFLLLLIIICLLVLLIYMNNKQNSNNNSKMELNDRTQYYIVKDCLEYYYNISNINSQFYFGMDQSGKKTKVVDETQAKQNIYELLSEKYIKDNNITIDNIFNFVDKFEKRVTFIPIDMYVLSGQNSSKYLVYGFIQDMGYNKIKDTYLYVNLDNINNTFSVELIDNKYNDINEINIENEDKQIPLNNNNKFIIPNVTYSYIVKDYYDTYKQIMLGDSKLAYEYLNEQYKNKRFESYQKFYEYIQENKKEIITTSMKNYSVNIENNEYISIDNKNNYYKFIQKDIMNYEVILDNYTLH